jgi:ribonuclease Z
LPFEIKILGTGSASPVYNRSPSSQHLNINFKHVFLIDCGEGTQFRLMRNRLSQNKITHIFITHLHGDHYFGLIGMISTMNLWGRDKELYLFGPRGLAEIITIQLRYSETFLNFKIIFKELDTTQSAVIADFDDLTVETIPLSHRISCCGFLFKEKPKRRRLIKIRLPEDITPLQKISLKKGEDITDNAGNFIKNEDVTLPPKKSLSYAYCSDTAYHEPLIDQIRGVDLLYHEATFHSDHADRAKYTFHTTSEEAALIAKKADVKQLLIGHFSGRYKDVYPLYEEAKSIFENTLLAEEGRSYMIEDRE